jgi:ubiquitin-protein ligase
MEYSKDVDKDAFEFLKAKENYNDLVKTEKLCNALIWKRILREVKDVNDDFISLRTNIGIVEDTIGVLHFLLYPGDGALSEKPLCGRIIIPYDYPTSPPIVHLFTRTMRYNVDAYHGRAERNAMGSSMCFDILRSEQNGGIWNSQYTLSALIASLLQAIVSINVVQEYGGEKLEFVSMETLRSIHHSVDETYNAYKKVMHKKISCISKVYKFRQKH